MLKQFFKTAAILTVPAMMAVAAHADESVTTGTGKVKFGALLQFWTVNDTSLGNTNVTGTTTPVGAKLNMRLRRAEMRFGGNVTDTTRFYIMVDPSKVIGADTKILQDAWIAQQLFMPELELQVGQQKIITTAEGLDPAGELMFPERSMVARTFGDYRETGAIVTYKGSMWKLAGMLGNGQGPNQDDRDIVAGGATQNKPNNKNLYIRGDIKPMEMVSAGAFTALTNFNYADRMAVGVNVRVMPIEDLVIRAEGVRGRQRLDTATNGLVTTATANQYDIPLNGWVVDAGYQYGDFQPVLRYEGQQGNNQSSLGVPTPTATSVNANGRAFTAGMNYFFSKHNYKLQFAYSILSNVNGSAFGSTLTNGQTATGQYMVQQGSNGGLAVLAFQAAL